MNLSPSKWHWSQWLCNICLIAFIITRFNTVYLITEVYDYGGGKLGGNIMTIIIVLATLIAHVYCFGIYYNIELEFLMFRVMIPASILGIEMFLVFAIGYVFKFSLKFPHILLVIFMYGVYVLSLILCYKKVEFNLVDMSELDE